jgi:hypothetical protein
MKKGILTKTFAILASVAVLGVSSLVGASAATNTTFSFEDVTAKAGETVTVNFDISDNAGLTSFGATATFDEGLTFIDFEVGNLFDASYFKDSGNRFVVTSAAEAAVTKDGTAFSLTFTVPEDAEVGTVYAIEWENLDAAQNGSEDVEVSLVNGSITVVEGGGGTTPPAPPVTTPATEDEAPKTGASTKGIAATSAVLLAAACSAVALKKKRD